jgi:hypothetical protein
VSKNAFAISEAANDGLQLRRAISIQVEGKKLLEKHAIAPSAARLCSAAREMHHTPAAPRILCYLDS